MTGREPLPAEIREAADALRRDGAAASVGLWLEPSWRAAQRDGMAAEEFAAWVRLGLWNLEGEPSVSRRVRGYREVAGSHGWALAAAGISIEEAAERAAREGVPAVVEAAEVMVALGELADLLPEGERPPRPVDEEPGRRVPMERLDFS